MTTDAIESLARERRTAAEREFAAYDFGETEVEGSGGWQWESPGTELHRVIFLAAEESHTERAHFVVRFTDVGSAVVCESYAMTSHGGIFGTPPMRG